jgi:3-oxoacyl-[acyl-carrier-protein] synthase III
MRNVYFGMFNHQLGEAFPVEGLAQLSGRDELRAGIAKCGFRHYRRAAMSPAQLARSCVEQLFDKHPSLANQIDTIVYASLTLRDSEFYNEQLGDCLVGLGLEQVNMVGLFSSECGNLGSALLVAQSLIRSGKAGTILVISADVCLDENKRIIDENVVVSDGASCFIVNSDPGNDFQLVDTLQRSNHRLRLETSGTYLPRYLKLSTDGMKDCVENLLAGHATSRGQISAFVTGNYSMPVLAMFSYVAGLKSALHFKGDVAGTAHAYACDIAINLQRLLTESPPAPGDKLLCLATGSSTWFASLLVKT